MLFNSGSKKKTLSIHIDSLQKTADGLPLLFGTNETPARIQGKVIFETDHDCCKGSPDINVTFTCEATSNWSVWTPEIDAMFHGYKRFESRKRTLPLKRTSSGLITKGEHSCGLNMTINVNFPSSMVLKHGKIAYTIKAKMTRKFPHRDIETEQVVWIMNSPMSPPEVVLLSLPDPTEMRPTSSPFLCQIPSNTLYTGEMIPIVIETRALEKIGLDDDDDAFSIQTDSARLFKDKHGSLPNPYKILSVNVVLRQIDKFYDHRDDPVMIGDFKEYFCDFTTGGEQGWISMMGPEGGREVLCLRLPDLWAIQGSTAATCVEVAHNLKVKVKFSAGMFKNKSLTFEFPITIVASPSIGGMPTRFHDDQVPASSPKMMTKAMPLLE